MEAVQGGGCLKVDREEEGCEGGEESCLGDRGHGRERDIAGNGE
jgi:hypothetical protein